MSTVDSSIDALIVPPNGFTRSSKLTLATETEALVQQALEPYMKSSAEEKGAKLSLLRFQQRTQRVTRETQDSSLGEHIGEFSPEEHRQAAQGESAQYTPIGKELYKAIFSPIEKLAQLRKRSIQAEWASKRSETNAGDAENQRQLEELREKRKQGITEGVSHCKEINDNLQPILRGIFLKDGSTDSEDNAEITRIGALAQQAISVVTSPAVLAPAARLQDK